MWPWPFRRRTIELSSDITGIQTEDANLETNFNAVPISVLPDPGNGLSAVALTARGVVMNTTGGSVFGGSNYEFFGLHDGVAPTPLLQSEDKTLTPATKHFS